MKFNQQLARHLAYLAKLNPDNPSLANIVDDMQRIITMVSVMNQVDTNGVEPLRHPIVLPDKPREDIPNALTPEEHQHMMDNAPVLQDELFIVPQVIE